MKHTFIYLIILALTAAVTYGKKVELTLHPAKVTKAALKYRLLPRTEELIDANALPLYEKAIQSLPKDYDIEQIHQWLKTPIEKLPHQQVQSTLQQYESAIQLFEQATKCKQCNWPYVEEDELETLSEKLSKYRRLIFILELQARLQIAQRQYDKALATMQTGFAMAQHLGESPNLLEGMVGIAISARMLRPLEQFIQAQDAPNLYWALQDLPRPLIDLTELLVLESPEIREKMHLQMNRLDRHIAALQCIEAIRLHAGAHKGKLPTQLEDIIEVTVSNDPVMDKPFEYILEDSKAVLKIAPLKDKDEKNSIHYELTIEK
jgi:tetratricopeptide (TPR) repeat protein